MLMVVLLPLRSAVSAELTRVSDSASRAEVAVVRGGVSFCISLTIFYEKGGGSRVDEDEARIE